MKLSLSSSLLIVVATTLPAHGFTVVKQTRRWSSSAATQLQVVSSKSQLQAVSVSSNHTTDAILYGEDYYPKTTTQSDRIALETIAQLETTSPTIDVEDEVVDAAQQREINIARLLLIGAAALYGTNFSCVKLLGESVPVGISSTLRFGMAALATSPWLLMRPKHSQQSQSQPPFDWKQPLANASPELLATIAGLEVGMWNSFGYVAQAIGLETTLASKSAFLCSLAVVTVPVIDAMTGKLLKQREMLGAAMALAGVAVLELGGLQTNELTSLSAGDVASLFQPLAFGMGFWRMEHAMHKYPNQANRSTAAQLLAVFITSFLYTAITDPAELDVHAVQQWLTTPMILASLVWTGVISTALTVYMETVALKTLSAAETTLIFSTEPLWGSMWAAAIMGEQFGADSVAGGVLILAGCLVSNLGWNGLKKFMNDRISTSSSSSQFKLPFNNNNNNDNKTL